MPDDVAQGRFLVTRLVLLLDLSSLFVLLHFADLGKHHFAEDGAPSELAQTPWSVALVLGRGGFVPFRSLQSPSPERSLGERFPSCLLSVSRHVGFAWDILFIIFLHLQSLNAVGELDQLNSTTKTHLGDVAANLGQQVVIGGSGASEPAVLQSFLRAGQPSNWSDILGKSIVNVPRQSRAY
jgi:hypothetical protein